MAEPKPAIRTPWPILWIDADNRLKEMDCARPWIEKGRIIPWTIDAPLIEDSIRARQVKYEKRGKDFYTIAAPSRQPAGYIKFLEMMDEADKFIPAQGIRTIVIDPMTRLIEHMMRFLAYQTKHGVIEESAWLIYMMNLEEVINSAMSHGLNTITTFHTREYYDEDSGRLQKVKPLVSGQMQSKVGSYFGEVWYNKIQMDSRERKYVVQTRPDPYVECRTSKPLDEIEPAHMPTIMKKGDWSKPFSLMLMGSFGSGKTTLITTLCEIEEEVK